MPANGTTIFSFNYKLIDAGSLGADIASNSWETKEIKTATIQAIWSGGGSPNGLMEIQGSLNNIDFTRIQGSILAVTGNSGTNGWNIEEMGYPYLRFVYTRTSGTANVDVLIAGKYI